MQQNIVFCEKDFRLRPDVWWKRYSEIFRKSKKIQKLLKIKWCRKGPCCSIDLKKKQCRFEQGSIQI
jgi:hypothetical protein